MILCPMCKTHSIREGRILCDVCLGLECPIPNTTPPLDLAICDSCGDYIKPYKLGRSTVKRGICYPCMMRKKYGLDWEPGGKKKTPEQISEYNRRYKARRKAMKEAEKMKEQDNGNGGDIVPGEIVCVDSMNTVFSYATPVKHVVIQFTGDDEAMYQRLTDLARKERRTVEQQVLRFLDAMEF